MESKIKDFPVQEETGFRFKYPNGSFEQVTVHQAIQFEILTKLSNWSWFYE